MNKSILIFSRQLVNELTLTGKHGTARSYDYSVHSLLKFAGDKDLTFSDLNPNMLKEYEQYLLNIGRTRNAVALNLRMLRAICNQAIDRLKIYLPGNLFENFFQGMDQSEKRVVSLQVLSRLAKLDLGHKPTSLGFARDIYMLSFYLRGIPFVNLAHLHKEDVREGILCYRCNKTKREVTVFLEPYALQIIEKYARYASDSPYLLPILANGMENAHFRYQNALRWYNRSLECLSQKLKLEYSLTSILGGSFESTSKQISSGYLTSLDGKVFRQVNQKVISNMEISKEEETDGMRLRKSCKRCSKELSKETDTNLF